MSNQLNLPQVDSNQDSMETGCSISSLIAKCLFTYVNKVILFLFLINVQKYAMCITEMSMMMACWKQNNFADALCSNEMQSFYKCVEKPRYDIAVKAISEHHIIGQGGCLQPKKATTLLK
uniref:CHCH domain-containing protein n=1 Tax=Oncorhynchus kisutch TaxID=8019 RepID=A0A8C7KJ77_ONCKI